MTWSRDARPSCFCNRSKPLPLEIPGVWVVPGPGVPGTLSKVKSLPLMVVGALESGAPILLYGTSGCREYGNRGRTTVTRLAEPVLQAEIIMQRSMKLSLTFPPPDWIM